MCRIFETKQEQQKITVILNVCCSRKDNRETKTGYIWVNTEEMHPNTLLRRRRKMPLRSFISLKYCQFNETPSAAAVRLAKGRRTFKHKAATRCQCVFVFEICFAAF